MAPGAGETVARAVHLRDAEVGEHRATRFVVEENVGRLDVAMDDAVAVRAFERVGQLGENAMRLVAGKPSVDPQTLGERHAADVAHDEVPDAVDLAEGVERQDPRVRQLRRDARLAPKSFATIGRGGKIGPQHLDRHESFERPLAREIDRAHAALPQRPDDLVLLAEGSGENRVERAIAVGAEASGVQLVTGAVGDGQ